MVCRISTAARCHTCQLRLSEKRRCLAAQIVGNNIPKKYGKRVTIESEGSRGYSFQYRFFALKGGDSVSHISGEVLHLVIGFSAKW